jgi:hypothetical protein
MTIQATAPAKTPQPEPDFRKLKFQFLEESKQSGTLTRLIRKHRHVMASVGALIVLATFIIKDAWRDNLSDFGAAIEKAEKSYALANHFSDMKLNLVIRVKNAVQDHPTAHTAITFKEICANYVETVTGFLYGTRYIVEERQSISPLVQHIEMPNTLSQRIEEFDKGTTALNQRVSSLSSLVWDLPNHPESAGLVQHLNAIKLVGSESNGIESDIEHSIASVETLTGEVLAEAHKQKSRNEHWYRIATWASYFLYAFGWGLGLVGRLVGVGAGSED